MRNSVITEVLVLVLAFTGGYWLWRGHSVLGPSLQSSRFSPDEPPVVGVCTGIDGFETCRQLKLNPKLSGIPVIFMTALHDTKEKLAAFAAGGVDYITKPFASEEVLERVKTHLTLRRLQRTLQDKNQQLAVCSAATRQQPRSAISGFTTGS